MKHAEARAAYQAKQAQAFWESVFGVYNDAMAKAALKSIPTAAEIEASGAGVTTPAGDPAALLEAIHRVTEDRALADVGGKGLFAKELEEALFAGR